MRASFGAPIRNDSRRSSRRLALAAAFGLLAGLVGLVAASGPLSGSFAAYQDSATGAQQGLVSGTWGSGSITIVKQTTPTIAAEDAVFSFDHDIPDCSLDELDTDTDTATPDEETCSDVPADTYTVEESDLPSGWALIDIQCSEDGAQNSSVDVDAGTATIVLDPDEEVTCTFINTETTLVLGASDDTWAEDGLLDTGHNNTHGSEATMRVADLLGTLGLLGGEYQAFLRFDLSAIPDGATINDASLRLCLASVLSVAVNAKLDVVAEDWDEETLNWNNKPDVAVDPLLPLTLQIAIGDFCTTIDVTDHVQDWVDGVRPNYGWSIDTEVLGLLMDYATKENSNLGRRPQLTIDFTP